jgi:hypothetical protein
MADKNILDNYSPVEGIIRFQIQRTITNQARKCLNMFEELLGAGYSFDFKATRKLILDEANDGIRELNLLLDRVDILPKTNKISHE